MTVLGLDLSLTSTGMATAYGDGGRDVRRIRPKTKGCERLIEIRDTIRKEIDLVPPQLIVLEGYAYAAAHQAAHIGELGGVVRVMLHEAGANWIEIPPTSLKKFATGKGNANKELMLACAIRELGYDGSSNDEADALWLAHLGHMSMRQDQLTVARRDVLCKIDALKLALAA